MATKIKNNQRDNFWAIFPSFMGVETSVGNSWQYNKQTIPGNDNFQSFLDGAPTSIGHFFHLSIYLSCTISQELCIM